MCPTLLGKYFIELLLSFNVTRFFMDISLFGNPSMRLDDTSRRWIRLAVSPLIIHAGMDLNWFSCKYTHFKHFKSSKFSHNVDKLFLLRSNIFKYINLKIRESNFFKLQKFIVSASRLAANDVLIGYRSFDIIFIVVFGFSRSAFLGCRALLKFTTLLVSSPLKVSLISNKNFFSASGRA